MARPRKKLIQADINRNSSIEVSHTIKRIKQHERRYTAILVIIFMAIFFVFGYNLLSVNNTKLLSDIKTVSKGQTYFASSSNIEVLTNDDILTDEDGLKSKKSIIHIVNNTNIDKKYKLKLVKTNCECGNKEFDIKDIRYSLNQKKVLKPNDDKILLEGTIKKNDKKDIVYNLWVNDINNKYNEEYHLHAHIEVEED